MKTLALFDFDGTLTTSDTLMVFLKYHAGPVRFYMGMTLLLPVLIAYKLKIIPNWRAKEIVLAYFLGGMSCGDFEESGNRFARNVLPGLLRSEATARLDWHLANNDDVVVVSASASGWIKPWTDAMGLKLLSTELVCENGQITGKIKGKNCFGPEKVTRIRDYLDLADYAKVYAYGDSRGDREMLAMATDPFYRKFG